jgi:serine/threonine-protein kinase HipA
MTRDVEVWIDADIAPSTRIGTLHDDRGQIRFHYDAAWRENPEAIAIDPALTLDAAPFFPNPEAGNFGVFLDSSPDRWGQTLMQRREALAARDEERRPRALHAWDYLLGVQYATRQGALRFRDPASGRFLADEALAAPPVTSLRELESVARELTGRRIDDLDRLRRWLAVLVAPGASLGGARPKANFTDTDGSLWIGKFPARDDDRDTGAWEYLAHRLGLQAGIDLPEARLVQFSDYHTFCVRRFDRVGGQRRFYASAMTMLGRDASEGTSYLDLAQFLQFRGDPSFIRADPKWLAPRAGVRREPEHRQGGARAQCRRVESAPQRRGRAHHARVLWNRSYSRREDRRRHDRRRRQLAGRGAAAAHWNSRDRPDGCGIQCVARRVAQDRRLLQAIDSA